MSFLLVEPHFLPRPCLSLVFELTTYLKVQHLAFRRVRRIAKNDYQLHHVCLSLRPLATTGLHWTMDFYKILMLEDFSKTFQEILISIKI